MFKSNGTPHCAKFNRKSSFHDSCARNEKGKNQKKEYVEKVSVVVVLSVLFTQQTNFRPNDLLAKATVDHFSTASEMERDSAPIAQP